MRKIQFYRKESGSCPVEDFLDSLTGRQAKKVIWVLKLIEDVDAVPKEYLKKLPGTKGIWEVRIRLDMGVARLLGFFHKDNLIVLNHAFMKKSRKIFRKDISVAEQRKLDFLRRTALE